MDFEEIYRRYFHDIYCYILGMSKNCDIAEEVTQETFFKALKAVKKYDDRGNITAWLFSIARNTYFTLCRKKHISLNEDILCENADESEDVLQKLIDDENAEKIQKILNETDMPYKEVFKLRVFGNLQFKEIGRVFGKSESWARVTFYRAKLKIREMLEEE